MSTKVYLSGAMTGIENYNFPGFHSAAKRLRDAGYQVFSPAERDEQDGFDPANHAAKPLNEYMAIDLPEVCKADAIALIPGWEKSRGVGIELAVAKMLGLKVIDAITLEPIKAESPADFKEVQDIAEQTVAAVMGKSRSTGKHAAATWLNESWESHLFKAIGHAQRHHNITSGIIECDIEDHLSLALCRIAMSKAVWDRKVKAGIESLKENAKTAEKATLN